MVEVEGEEEEEGPVVTDVLRDKDAVLCDWKDGEREPVDLSSGGRPNAFCRAAGHWSMMDRVNRPQMTRKSRENHEAGPQEIATEDSGIHSDCLLLFTI